MPASADLIRGLMSSRRWTSSLIFQRNPLLTKAFAWKSGSAEEELVVTGASFFPHPITQGYSDPRYGVIKRFNGKRVRTLPELIEMMRDSEDAFFTFEFTGLSYETLVFDREEFLQTTEEVLDENGIRRQGSLEYLEIWD